MNIVRYSAIEQFGIPIYDPDILRQEREPELIQLLGQYAIEPVEVPVCQGVDITPFYLREETPAFQYISRAAPGEPVVIEHLAREADTTGAYIQRKADQSISITMGVRQTIIPTDARSFAWVALNGPRYHGTPTLHELIIPKILGRSGQ